MKDIVTFIATVFVYWGIGMITQESLPENATIQMIMHQMNLVFYISSAVSMVPWGFRLGSSSRTKMTIRFFILFSLLVAAYALMGVIFYGEPMAIGLARMQVVTFCSAIGVLAGWGLSRVFAGRDQTVFS